MEYNELEVDIPIMIMKKFVGDLVLGIDIKKNINTQINFVQFRYDIDKKRETASVTADYKYR